MNWWALLLVVFAVWLFAAFAGVFHAHAEHERRGTPRDQRSGVSLVPLIPIAPLAFWGVALLADLVAAPLGTFGIGWLHAVFAALLVGSVCRDWWRLRRIHAFRR